MDTSHDHEYVLPLRGATRGFAFSAPWPLSDDEWDYVMNLLSMYRPALTTTDDTSAWDTPILRWRRSVSGVAA